MLKPLKAREPLPAHELDVALKVSNRHRGAPITNVANDAAAFAHQLETVGVPEWAHLDLFGGGSRHQTKTTVRRKTQSDISLTRFELVRAAGCELAVKENVAGGVGGEHASRIDACQNDIARSPDVRAHQITLNVIDGNLTAARFEIDRRSCRQLNLEVHVSDIVTSAVVADDVNHQT